MKEFQRSQIWLVNFDPSFGHEYKKVRPALIIQHNKYLMMRQKVIYIKNVSKL